MEVVLMSMVMVTNYYDGGEDNGDDYGLKMC